MAKKLLFLICLIACWNFSVVLGNSTPSVETSLACPVPGNFHVVSVSSTYVNLAWNPAPGATGYLLRTFEASGNLVSSMVVTDTFATVDGLQPGTEYYSLLSSECEGEPGFGVPNTARVDYLTLIIDLIVYASGTNDVVVDNLGSCTWLPWDNTNNAYWIEVIEDETNRFVQFPVIGVLSTDIPPIQVGARPTGTMMDFEILNHIHQSAEVASRDFFYISRGEDIYRVDVYINSNPGRIKLCETIEPGMVGYTFRLLRINRPKTPGGGVGEFTGDPGDSQRSDESIEDNRDQLYVLNPFTDYLYIHAPQQREGACNIQLFDLNGKLVLEQYDETGQKQYSLPTADLPTGFYFLRMETGGKVQTYKVVK